MDEIKIKLALEITISESDLEDGLEAALDVIEGACGEFPTSEDGLDDGLSELPFP